jgi:predicted nucleic-acid-binding Zn-ribbon protein
MRITKQCPKCSGKNIGYLESLPDIADTWPPDKAIIGHTLAEQKKWTIGTARNMHEIEVYVCTTCGYLEYYTKQPETVPFERLDGFSWYSKEK